MKTFPLLLSSLLCLLLTSLQLQAQLTKPSVSAQVSPLQTTPLTASYQYQKSANKEDWNVSIGYLGIKHGSSAVKSKEDSIKQLKMQKKISAQSTPKKNEPLSSATAPLAPLLKKDFKGNSPQAISPPDNHIAISNDGRIVSVINGSILFSDDTGAKFGEKTFNVFFESLGLGSRFFDPKAIYDPIEDKFIVVCLNGNSPDNSNLVIAFSASNNPLGNWQFYRLPGDPLGLAWFDFPSVGISEKELFISGNLFNNGFSKSLLFQIEKKQGFLGETLNWKYWDDLKTSDGDLAFTVLPISSGFGTPEGPGIYMISREMFSGDQIMLYQITETIDNDPELLVQAIDIDPFESPIYAQQKGSNFILDLGRLNLAVGFHADSTIYFTFQASNSGIYSGIYYGQIDLTTMLATSSFYSEDGFDLAYPSIAPFALTPDDQTVIFGFLRAGKSIYPEFRTIVCDENLEWSNSTLVRQGKTYVNSGFTGVSRWGDYSGISRRYNATQPEIWVAGCYGDYEENSNSTIRRLFTWIGQLVANDEKKLPEADFVADDTLSFLNDAQVVTFADLSINDPTSWSWSFPGGEPATSTARDPEIRYLNKGVYPVSLIISNSLGSDTITKVDYITVGALTICDFEADQTTVEPGDTVNFTDLSSHAEAWNWVFPGTPTPSSDQQNPMIIYNNPGTFEVRLQVSNPWSTDQTTKAAYITVNAKDAPPSTNFIANQTIIEPETAVSFFDLSNNSPDTWNWTFTGGVPATSTEQNPVVTYDSPGTYDVSLVAGNAFGDSTAIKTNYITVNNKTATTNLNSGLKSIILYPNPATPQDRIYVDFDLEETIDLSFLLYDQAGKLIKRLLRHRSKAGTNRLSFQVDMLAPGTYNLLLQDQQNQLIGAHRLMVID